MAERRRKRRQEFPALFDPRCNAAAVQYMAAMHEQRVQALGQELTACGWGAYLGPTGKGAGLPLRLPCQDSRFPDDAYHTVQSAAGNFASGIWIAKEKSRHFNV